MHQCLSVHIWYLMWFEQICYKCLKMKPINFLCIFIMLNAKITKDAKGKIHVDWLQITRRNSYLVLKNCAWGKKECRNLILGRSLAIISFLRTELLRPFDRHNGVELVAWCHGSYSTLDRAAQQSHRELNQDTLAKAHVGNISWIIDKGVIIWRRGLGMYSLEVTWSPIMADGLQGRI